MKEWRTSGETASVFCTGKEFSAGGLRYWASRLGRDQGVPRKRERPAVARGPQGAAMETPKQVRLARVERGPRRVEVTETPIVIEVGQGRVGVRRGFDAASLRVVLDLLGGGR